jgi:hypothetical protein
VDVRGMTEYVLVVFALAAGLHLATVYLPMAEGR